MPEFTNESAYEAAQHFAAKPSEQGVQKAMDLIASVRASANVATALEKVVAYRLSQRLEAVVTAQAHTWRCFHCDEVFFQKDQAKEHFGRSDLSQPACQINAAEYRNMEERVRRCNEEDSDLHRAMHAMQSQHGQDLLREEERGYARGLQDAQKHTAELVGSN